MSGEGHANPVGRVTPAEARVAAAAAERREARRSSLHGSAATTLRDVLVGLSEREEHVLVGAGAGRSHRMRMIGVGTDVVVGHGDNGATLLIGLDTVGTVRPVAVGSGPGSPAAGSTDGARLGDVTHVGWSMADILTHRVADRPRITAWRDTDQVTGTLLAVGLDVATVGTDAAGGPTYVRLDSTTEISVSDSSSL